MLLLPYRKAATSQYVNAVSSECADQCAGIGFNGAVNMGGHTGTNDAYDVETEKMDSLWNARSQTFTLVLDWEVSRSGGRVGVRGPHR